MLARSTPDSQQSRGSVAAPGRASWFGGGAAPPAASAGGCSCPPLLADHCDAHQNQREHDCETVHRAEVHGEAFRDVVVESLNAKANVTPRTNRTRSSDGSMP